MKLTGKAKEQFEKWLETHSWFGSDRYDFNPLDVNIDGHKINFNNLHYSMQWGVYQDWADSLGYVVNTYCNASGYLYEIHRNADNGGTHLHDSGYEANTEHGAWYTIQEARTAALKKLNELINEKA